MPHAQSITLLNIEFNSSCNLRCKWCSLDHTKKRKIMIPELLEHIMNDLASNPFENLKRIDLHNGGETLLHPDLPNMLSIIRRFRPMLSQKPVVGLLTNAMLLTPKVSEQIVRSRAITQIRFSLDGGTPELFEDIRRGAKWKTVAANILTFLHTNMRAGNPISTEALCIIPSEGLPGGSMSPEFTGLLEKIDKVSLRHPHNWDGSVELGVDDSSYRNIASQRLGEACFLLERNLVILPDGNVTVCCNDLNARGVIGSVLHQQLRTLAAQPKRLAMLEAFRKGNKQSIPLCRNCTGFYSVPKEPK